MSYIIRKTRLSDLAFLPDIEKSAAQVFNTFPELSWLASADVMSIDEHRHAFETGLSWAAVDEISQDILGFMVAKIIGNDFYISEVSVSEAQQKKGIGSKLFETAMIEAANLGIRWVTLATFIDVPWNAPFYERLGFVILDNQALPSYLGQILQDEAQAGLPLDRRCAMRKSLGTLPS